MAIEDRSSMVTEDVFSSPRGQTSFRPFYKVSMICMFKDKPQQKLKIVFVGRGHLRQGRMGVSSVSMPKNALTFSAWIRISDATGTWLVFPTCGNMKKNSMIGS